ncbi:hypothetical protein LOC68_05680 [Blastopirellula sp. JC732]|uniref:NfeD-like C-terminal domain-containing protein n=1 Tax=Blastopirellula sediminis TaxID=2894196 RepID=A0A9X1ML23_9BACT|nr:hypothetical protein [Blastopirellula sediminis]MCC9609346.1 hypothetical protein [Blastopirellula sediminis]MCC9627877.1 hypothetical protein [Blastopirellula sediminis]
MSTMFLICAVLGGSIFVIQFLLTLIGIGGEALELEGDIPDDLDLPDDTDFSATAHHSTWLFGVLSFKTIVAAIAFFGIAGLAAESANIGDAASLVVAIVFGIAAMYVVHWLMLFIYKLGVDGTTKISDAVGQAAKVYVPIPGENGGQGKIQMQLNNQIVEYAAMTSETEKLATGTSVRVVRVIDDSTLEVARLSA